MSYSRLCQIANKRNMLQPQVLTKRTKEQGEFVWEVTTLFAGFTTHAKAIKIKEALDQAANQILENFPENTHVESSRRKMLKKFLQVAKIEINIYTQLGGYKLVVQEADQEFTATADNLNDVYSSILSLTNNIYNHFAEYNICIKHKEQNCILCHTECDICQIFGETCDDCRRM